MSNWSLGPSESTTDEIYRIGPYLERRRRTKVGDVIVSESIVTGGAHGLRRVYDEDGDRWYFYGVRVPWIVWAMFS